MSSGRTSLERFIGGVEMHIGECSSVERRGRRHLHVAISGVTISDGLADAGGGIVSNSSAFTSGAIERLTVTNCTITGNDGGGTRLDGPVDMALRNSIVANNSGDKVSRDRSTIPASPTPAAAPTSTSAAARPSRSTSW